MANLFSRIKNVVMADLNEALEQKENKNPIALLNQYLRQSEQETEKVRKLVERQYRLKAEFTKEYHEAVKLAEKRQQQAEIAAKAGESELSQFALKEHQQYAERVEHLQASLAQINEQLVNLENRYEEMKHKLKDMQLRRMELMGRENVTRANQRINQVLESDTYSNTSYSRFKEIENYLERLEHQVNSSYYRSTIDAKVAELEKNLKLDESKSI
jgi:lia operon protein LiaH